MKRLHMKKTIYSLVVINENMEIVGISSYTNRDAAVEALEEDYNNLLKTLEAEGWGEDDLSENEFNEFRSYWVQYGESSYYAEIKENELED